MSTRPRPKYQIFISSTYDDLHKEREAVSWAVLKERHIPAGMENFTATPDRGWKVIQRAIDDSDYYVVVVAGRYGSADDNGLGWTEREYDYAREKKIPCLAFIRFASSTTADKMEADPDAQAKLARFKKKLRDAHLCKEWDESSDLVAEATAALRHQIQDDEDSEVSRLGWFRGDALPSARVLEEIARLSAENASLRKQAEANQLADLRLLDAQGAPLTTIERTAEHRAEGDRSTTGFYYIRLDLQLMNSSALAVANARVRFRFRNADVVGISQDQRFGMLAISSAEFADSSRNVFVDNVADKGREVTQWIQSVPVHGEERLITMAMQIWYSGKPSGTRIECGFEYTVTADNAHRLDGACNACLRIK